MFAPDKNSTWASPTRPVHAPCGHGSATRRMNRASQLCHRLAIFKQADPDAGEIDDAGSKSVIFIKGQSALAFSLDDCNVQSVMETGASAGEAA